jgi:uncharacterized protein
MMQIAQNVIAIGQTEPGRPLFVAFTIRIKGRQRFIRPISARYMHANEIQSYEAQNP